MSKKNEYPEYSLTLKQLSKINTISSYLTAVGGAIVFHPIDRALFLSVANKRNFFVKANFVEPFHGLLQTVMYKQVIGSVYFFAQGELQQRLSPVLRHAGLSESGTQLFIGTIAGAVDGAVKNTPSAIRANTWQYGGGFISSTYRMWKNGGVKPFINGAPATIFRDSFFGATYEFVRKNLRDLANDKNKVTYPGITNFLADTFAAGTATIACSPINYARTMQYKTEPGAKPPTIIESVLSLAKNTLEAPTFFGKMRFFQQRVNIGVGTVRVAGGMAATQFAVDGLRGLLQAAATDPNPSLTGDAVKRVISP